jgi:hypothetical protein
MKTLSIRHPWIDLILAGNKTIEIRTWATRYRGRLLLHASAGYGISERDASARFGLERPAPQTLGAIVGVAYLVECRKVQPEDWQHALLPPLEGKLWAWVFTGARAVEPIPCAGKRTLFDVDEPLVAALA